MTLAIAAGRPLHRALAAADQVVRSSCCRGRPAASNSRVPSPVLQLIAPERYGVQRRRRRRDQPPFLIAPDELIQPLSSFRRDPPSPLHAQAAASTCMLPRSTWLAITTRLQRDINWRSIDAASPTDEGPARQSAVPISCRYRFHAESSIASVVARRPAVSAAQPGHLQRRPERDDNLEFARAPVNDGWVKPAKCVEHRLFPTLDVPPPRDHNLQPLRTDLAHRAR